MQIDRTALAREKQLSSLSTEFDHELEQPPRNHNGTRSDSKTFRIASAKRHRKSADSAEPQFGNVIKQIDATAAHET